MFTGIAKDFLQPDETEHKNPHMHFARYAAGTGPFRAARGYTHFSAKGKWPQIRNLRPLYICLDVQDSAYLR